MQCEFCGQEYDQHNPLQHFCRNLGAVPTYLKDDPYNPRCGACGGILFAESTHTCKVKPELSSTTINAHHLKLLEKIAEGVRVWSDNTDRYPGQDGVDLRNALLELEEYLGVNK